jgi:hypothetical protein
MLRRYIDAAGSRPHARAARQRVASAVYAVAVAVAAVFVVWCAADALNRGGWWRWVLVASWAWCVLQGVRGLRENGQRS